MLFIYFERGEGREKERERNINVWLPLTCPLLGTWPTTQACVLSGNWTGNPLVLRLALNPLSHKSQGLFLKKDFIYLFFLERGERWERNMCERNIDWLPLTHPQMGMCLETQVCALTGNWTSDLSVCRPEFNPLSHTSQGSDIILSEKM